MVLRFMTDNVTDKDFDNIITNSNIPVLIDFWAPWCGPCRMLSPIIDEVAKDLEGKVKILKMNIDENLETPGKYGVRSIPTLMLFKNNKLLETKVGGSDKDSIKEWIDNLIK
jgi:thioredoxin 1